MAAGNVTPSDRDMADNMIGSLKNISVRWNQRLRRDQSPFGEEENLTVGSAFLDPDQCPLILERPHGPSPVDCWSCPLRGCLPAQGLFR